MTPQDVASSMTEDELLTGLTDAMTLAGWRWMHILRSDGVTVGSSGWPDLVAVHPDRPYVIAWELKGYRTPVTPDQAAWLAGLRDRTVDARLVRPADYDQALNIILGRTTIAPAEDAIREIDPREAWPANWAADKE